MNNKFEQIIFNELKMYSNYTFTVFESHSERLEIRVINDFTKDIVFRIVLNIDNEYPKEVQIPIIFLGEDLRYKGIGKKIIYLIYNICKENEYRLFIVDLVESFYNKLVNRGAQIVKPYDVVEITDDTRLI